ncbi:MAG: ferrous iron transporter B [Bacteroidota bacterium]|nr:ferrous iron transporter B [Bacteroidota bacterium]MDE2646462.1 ferrous iron transporter B [Bacteroidota bacterium]
MGREMLHVPTQTVVLLGKENVGKTQLAASLADTSSTALNFRSVTVGCDSCQVDALEQLRGDDIVLLVARETELDVDLADLLPLAAGRLGALVVTFRDHLARMEMEVRLRDLSLRTRLPVIAVDAQRLDSSDRQRLMQALEEPSQVPAETGLSFDDLMVRPRPLFLERSALGPFWALLLLLIPVWMAVDFANRLAGRIDPWFRTWSEPLAGLLTSWPQPFAELFAGDYGFVTMGPLLMVWATPVVVLHALLMGGYKASGLLDRLTTAMNPWLRPFGVTGRDLTRVVMGFGCNVPAVIGARSSPACSRGVCVSAITFGSACSYQLGATLAVFAVAGRPELVVAYLLYLGATTLAYVRIIAPPAVRFPFNMLLTEDRVLLTWPQPRAVLLEAQGVVLEFFRRALPVFFLITAAVSLLHWLGVLQAASVVVEPAMAIFRLPPEAAPAVVFASVRKDGILLLAEPGFATSLSAVQLLTAVYLAGVLLPCLVTCLTVAREQSRGFALRLVGRQAVAAIGFSSLLAWGGAWL